MRVTSIASRPSNSNPIPQSLSCRAAISSGFIATTSSTRSPYSPSCKVIDRYIRANGIDPKVPPVSILDVNFPKLVRDAGSSRVQASEMEHAARYHISVHFVEDPAHYRRLSERLEE